MHAHNNDMALEKEIEKYFVRQFKSIVGRKAYFIGSFPFLVFLSDVGRNSNKIKFC